MDHQHMERATGGAPLKTDEQEAWGIAIDLIAELGRADAAAWADEYMDGLRDAGDDRGVGRWSLVTHALGALTHATIQ